MVKYFLFFILFSLNLKAQTCLESIQCVDHHYGLVDGGTEISPGFCKFNEVSNQVKLTLRLKENGKNKLSSQSFGPNKTLEGLATEEQMCSIVRDWEMAMPALRASCQSALEVESKKWLPCQKKRTIPNKARVNDSSIEKILIENKSYEKSPEAQAQ